MNIFPNEICYYIIKYLYFLKDIVNISSISKRFYYLLKSNHIWKHYFDNKYSLQVADQIDGSLEDYQSVYQKYYRVSLLIKKLQLSTIYAKYKYIDVIPFTLVNDLLDSHILEISGRGIIQIPFDIGRLTGLQQLYLRNNRITTIPSEISQLVNLQRLDLSCNRIKFLPREIYKLIRLECLDLHCNYISIISKDIGQLVDLKYLDLCNNVINSIPREINQLVNLKKFVYSQNCIVWK